jgi:homoserine kinase
MMRKVTVRAPATSANLGAGFDVFGLSLGCLYDEVSLELRSERGIILELAGGYCVPEDETKNCASVAARTVFGLKGEKRGAIMRIKKGIRPASGMGSSAASSAAGALAASLLLGGLSTEELLRCAAEGERASCGSSHMDNVAPALFGGFTIVRSYEPIDVVRIDPPENLGVVAILPEVSVSTRVAREILPQNVAVSDAVKNIGNASAFVAGMVMGDISLAGRAMEDAIFERARGPLVPWLSEVKRAAIDAGALGSALSGSGPAVMAIFDRRVRDGHEIGKAMKEALGMEGEAYVCVSFPAACEVSA